MAALFFYFAKFANAIMRGIVAQFAEHWSIYITRDRWFKSILFFFYFCEKGDKHYETKN